MHKPLNYIEASIAWVLYASGKNASSACMHAACIDELTEWLA